LAGRDRGLVWSVSVTGTRRFRQPRADRLVARDPECIPELASPARPRTRPWLGHATSARASGHHASFVILFVADVATSARFYADLLGFEPSEQSPAFAAFALPSGLMLGLWAAKTVTPR
jgi:hypothetical protein